VKVPITVNCLCGNDFPVTVHAGKKFPAAVCPECGASMHIFEHLSISVVADLLLYRSKSEMEGADYTLSIICSAMAVECFLTRAFLKWKEIDSLKSTGHLATEQEKSDLEKEYTKSAGFLTPSDFASNSLVGMGFDEFVATNPNATAIMNGFLDAVGQSPKKYFQQVLFNKRNRILHWGQVSYERVDAESCLKAAIAIGGILKIMDRQRGEKMERDWRLANP
jgi:hypothetical protein